MKKSLLKIIRKILPTGVPYLMSQHYYFSYFLFAIKQKHHIYKAIKKFGFKKVKPLEPSTWKLIVKKRRFNRMRFTALDKNNQKVFIKVGFNDIPTINECNVGKYLKDNNIKLEHGLNCLFSLIDNKYSFCIYPFIEKFENFHNFFYKNDFRTGCKLLNEALDEFNTYGLVHCDLNSYNFCFINNNLFFLDFGTLKVCNKSLTPELEKTHWGCSYKIIKNELVYDDADDIVEKIKYYKFEKGYENCAEFLELKSKIGRNVFISNICQKEIGSIEVLVPTHHKSNEECKQLVSKLKIDSKCLISNQNGVKAFEQEGLCKILTIDSIGVSNNRQSLLDNASGDICVCIDDDCPLVNHYVELIKNEFDKHPKADFILFNGIVANEKNRLVHDKKTKRVRKFNDVSYAGGPGLVFKREAIKKYNLSYNKNVGFPNEIILGEDSLFIRDIVKSGANFIRSSKVLFIVKDDVVNSSYFEGVTEKFVISKGCITKLLHPRLFFIYKYHYAFSLRKWRNNSFKYFKLVKLLKIGSKKSKEVGD